MHGMVVGTKILRTYKLKTSQNCLYIYRDQMERGKSVINRSDPAKLRILLCDTNAETCHEMLARLRRCSYQDAVWSASEVMDTVNSQGPLADIIVAEIGLLMADEAYLMRYIMRDQRLQYIPIIVLTMQDQVLMTMKALRLGAMGYLVMPLHSEDELSILHLLFQN